MTSSEEVDIQRLYKYCSLSGENREFTRQIIVDKELYYPSPHQLNDPFDLAFSVSMDGARHDGSLLDTQEQHCDFVQQWLNDDAYEHIGIFSLSEAKDLPLMWSHYANGHRGVCLEFAVPVCLELHRVKYERQRPVLYFADVFEADGNKTRMFKSIISTLTTKSPEWHREQEWRCIATDGHGKRPMSTIVLTGVIFGCRTSEKDKNNVRTWLDDGKHDVSLHECRMIAEEFRLEVLRSTLGTVEA